MKKIITSLGMIVFAAAIVVGGTGAFFSDTETSTGNVFTAGALDLQIDNTSYGFDWNDPTNENPTGEWGLNENNSWAFGDLNNCGPNLDQPCLFFNFADLKPGDYGEDTISLHVQNDAWACMALNLTATPENDINGPEVDAGDITEGEQGGELQNYLSFIFWNDDGDNVLEVGEGVIDELSGLPGSIFTGELLPIAEAGDVPLQGGETSYIGKGWCFGTMTAAPVAQDGVSTTPPSAPDRIGFTCDGSGDHNIAQTDGIVVDVEFTSVQARHNPNFVCGTTTAPLPDPILTLEKIVNQDGVDAVADSNWILTATGPVVVSGTDNDPGDSPAITNITVPAGVYTLTEVGQVEGFAFQAIQCSDGVLVDNVLTLAPGDNALCTFTNLEINPE